jgi:hypothetical protein
VDQPEFASRFISQISDTSRAFVQEEMNQKVIIEYDVKKNDTIKWDKFPIRFAINKASFNTVSGGYDSLRKNMLQATRDWTNLCKVNFEYIENSDQKADRSKDSLDFIISYKVPGRRSNEEASSFYPNDLRELRSLFIFPAYWKSKNNTAGILRHEIGHILGFRHEHASRSNLVPLDCIERYSELDIPSKPVTVYDSFSVMHYFCGGAGTRAMKFSRYDSLGFTTVYGKK